MIPEGTPIESTAALDGASEVCDDGHIHLREGPRASVVLDGAFEDCGDG